MNQRIHVLCSSVLYAFRRRKPVTSRRTILFSVAGILMLLPGICAAETLSGTKAIEWEEADLSGRLMDGAHAFVERKIADAAAKRKRFWKYDLSSREAYVASIAENRAALKVILGIVDMAAFRKRRVEAH